MAAATHVLGGQSAACRLGRRSSRVPAGVSSSVCRPSLRRRQETVCFGSAMLATGSAPAAQLVVQLATGAAWTGVLYMASRLLLQQVSGRAALCEGRME